MWTPQTISKKYLERQERFHQKLDNRNGITVNYHYQNKKHSVQNYGHKPNKTGKVHK